MAKIDHIIKSNCFDLLEKNLTFLEIPLKKQWLFNYGHLFDLPFMKNLGVGAGYLLIFFRFHLMENNSDKAFCRKSFLLYEK